MTQKFAQLEVGRFCLRRSATRSILNSYALHSGMFALLHQQHL